MIEKNIDTSIEFTPQNPFTIDIPTQEDQNIVGNPGYPIEPEKSGFFQTAKAEFQETSTNYHLLHLASAPLKDPAGIEVQYIYPDINDKFYHPAPPGWSPKQEIDKQSNLDPKFLPALMATKNPNDFQYVLSSIHEQEQRDQVLQNGSTLAKIFGGLVGISPIGSIEDFYPLVAIATKAKVASGFISGLTKNIPGILSASAIHEGAYEMDKIDGNLPRFLKDTFIDAAFGTVFFGGIGAFKSGINLSEFNHLKQFARDHLDGISFNYKIDKAGNLKGFEAIDTTGGSISAAKLTRAQEQADAAFYKGGIFKIPYVGNNLVNLISGNLGNLSGINKIPILRTSINYLMGSPLVRLKTSKYKAANAFADAGFDHFITTEGEMKGQTREPSFEKKVKQTRAMLTALKAKTDALHAEANGYSITARPTLNIQNAWSAVKQKSIETLSRESQSTNWISKEDFMDKAQRVMVTGVSHENPKVNELAVIYRNVYDSTIKDYLIAHNLPEDYFRNMDKYLSRVYNTPYMLENEIGENGWIPIISNWFREADEIISRRMEPINNLKTQIKDLKKINSKHPDLLKMRLQLKQEKEKLQNEIRAKPEYDYHTHDRYALSADEANELIALMKPLNDMKKQLKVEKDKVKINELKRNIQDEEYKLYDAARNGKINPRLFNPINQKFRDPKDRLKFRKVFTSHEAREKFAKSAYDSITHMQPEDIISDIFGRIVGNKEGNPLLRRTLLIPDEVLYNHNFMTKDLYAKTANYVNFLSKRTHLKTSFKNVTVNGDFNELATDLLNEYQANRDIINKRIESLTNPKEIAKEKKKLKQEEFEFNYIKNDMKQLYETRMMGINKRSDFDNMARRTLMSLTSAANLHNMLATQITDVGFQGFQHGIWPSVRDGIYPIIESLGGILKTKDSEALREMAPHIHLGYQDMLNHYADRNWNADTQPYLNMGKIVTGIEKFAHFSALTDLSPYVDNGLQRSHGSVIQSRFMELLHRSVKGTLSEKDSLYLRKYGIDPKVWDKRMIDAYKEAEGFKTKLGGFMSKSWKWQDLEAANVFNDAVFRGIQNTLVFRGMADSPFFADNILGMFFHTFTGWTYAATNRYLIPSMQHSDGELLLKMMWMAGAGSLVSPMRRISRGEDPLPEDMTSAQHAYEVWSDSGVFSSIANVLNLANFLSNDKLLGDLKNDKFKNRVKTGIFGMSDVISSTISRVSDVLGMVNSGLNEKDLKTVAHMLPLSGAMYGHYLGDKYIENKNLPRNKRAAEIEKGV